MTNDIFTERSGQWGVITLNRPGALNALSLGMIRAIDAALHGWLDDPAIAAILLRAVPGRAFCAGGDVKALWQAEEGDRVGYFAEEYRLDLLLHQSVKPVVALLDGIVMGGGFGLAGPCRHRIVTENTLFAMPEVGIGFFPDVGSAYFLSRCPDEIGAYLALTGTSIGPGDMIEAGLATQFVPAARLAACADDLLASGAADIDAILVQYAVLLPPAELNAHRGVISQAFAGSSVAEIVATLNAAGTDWAAETAALLATRSPASLAVTLAHLRWAWGRTFAEVIRRDLELCQHFLAGQDFREGVRAALIDRDGAPRWAAAEDIVARYAGPGAMSPEEFGL